MNSGNIDCLNSIFGDLDNDYVNGYAVRIIKDVKKLPASKRDKAKVYLRESSKGNIKMSWAASQISKMAK